MKLLLFSSALAQLDGSGEDVLNMNEISDKSPLASLELLAPIYQEGLAPLR